MFAESQESDPRPDPTVSKSDVARDPLVLPQVRQQNTFASAQIEQVAKECFISRAKVLLANALDEVGSLGDDSSFDNLRSLHHRNLFLVSDTAETTAKIFSKFERVYLDIDGTIVQEGHIILSPECANVLRECNEVGLEVVLGPTGKPLTEIEPLLASIPSDIQVKILYEKGAYRLLRGVSGDNAKVYLLSSPELEQSISELARKFYPSNSTLSKGTIGSRLENEFDIVIVPAGSGTHKSVLSFDVLRSGSPRNFEDFTHDFRKELKVTDQNLLDCITRRFADLVAESHVAGLEEVNIVHLGNANIELSPKQIDKDLAVKSDLLRRPGARVAVVGDSLNDLPMLQLSREFPEQVYASLVLYREASLACLPSVSSVVFGEANAINLLKLIVAAKRSIEQHA